MNMDFEVIWWIVAAIVVWAGLFIGLKLHDRKNLYVDWIAEGDWE